MVAMRSLAKAVVVIAACKGSISIISFFVRMNLSGMVKDWKLIESSSRVAVPKGMSYEKASREDCNSLTAMLRCRLIYHRLELYM